MSGVCVSPNSHNIGWQGLQRHPEASWTIYTFHLTDLFSWQYSNLCIKHISQPNIYADTINTKWEPRLQHIRKISYLDPSSWISGKSEWHQQITRLLANVLWLHVYSCTDYKTEFIFFVVLNGIVWIHSFYIRAAVVALCTLTHSETVLDLNMSDIWEAPDPFLFIFSFLICFIWIVLITF